MNKLLIVILIFLIGFSIFVSINKNEQTLTAIKIQDDIQYEYEVYFKNNIAQKCFTKITANNESNADWWYMWYVGVRNRNDYSDKEFIVTKENSNIVKLEGYNEGLTALGIGRNRVEDVKRILENTGYTVH